MIEDENSDYDIIFISVFDHWLTENEFNKEIHEIGEKEIANRRRKFENFISELYDLTPTYLWKYKKQNRFYIYSVNSKNHLLKRCDIKNQTGESGKRYDIILPEFRAVYSEEWDWTNIIRFKERDKIEPLLTLAREIGLNVLEKN
ncbi:hypothetical protein [uncultured Christiangramia sp.]|uniref:hypothetical protein n=1 Tax=Christiangramia sp. 3-2217-3z TaxID=3417564 RepID=UPI0026376C0B|nr:hypothetical protein [uncultured Christiangramia sp.]